MEIEKLVLKILIFLLDATYLEIIASLMTIIGASLVAQKIKHLPTMWETWVRSLGQEDPLEKEMATHSSILHGKSYGERSLVGYHLWGHKKSDMI